MHCGRWIFCRAAPVQQRQCKLELRVGITAAGPDKAVLESLLFQSEASQLIYKFWVEGVLRAGMRRQKAKRNRQNRGFHALPRVSLRTGRPTNTSNHSQLVIPQINIYERHYMGGITTFTNFFGIP